VGAYIAHNTPANVVEDAHNSLADVVEYQKLGKISGEYLDPALNHLQHVASNSPTLRRVMPDVMGTRPRNACELGFSSLHSVANIPQQQPKYLDKARAESDSRSQVLFPGEWSRSEE